MNTINTIGDSIPQDLMIEILLRLPPKSVLRFRTVSKSWDSIIRSQQFIHAFMSLSLTQPRLLLLAFNDYDGKPALGFSSPQQNCSFLSLSSMRIPPNFNSNYCCIGNSVRGFICCSLCSPGFFVVCNPSTGQVIPLPESSFYCRMYLGYDSGSDQYKVLRLTASNFRSHMEHSVLTLGGQGTPSWRPIKSNIPYYKCFQNGVYIYGVVYYKLRNVQSRFRIGSFDFGSELFCLIEETPEDLPDDLGRGNLANYMGKLALICRIDNGFRLWIFDNQVWSKKTHMFQSSTRLILLKSTFHRFEGITRSGEIVFVPRRFSDPFDIFFCDVEKKMERRVRLEGTENIHCKSFSLLCSYVNNLVYL